MRNFHRTPEPGRTGPVVAHTSNTKPYHRLILGGGHARLAPIYPTVEGGPVSKDGEGATPMVGPVPMRVGVTRMRG